MQLHSVLQAPLRSIHASLRYGGFSSPSSPPLRAVPDGACTSVSVNQQSCFTCAPRRASIQETGLSRRTEREFDRRARSPCARQAGPTAQSRTPNPESCAAVCQSCPFIARCACASMRALSTRMLDSGQLATCRPGARQRGRRPRRRGAHCPRRSAPLWEGGEAQGGEREPWWQAQMNKSDALHARLRRAA